MAVADASAAVQPCPGCGAEAAAPDARFCARCGTSLESGDTVQEVLPPEDPPRVPVAFQRAEARVFGLAPPTLLLALASAAVVAGVVMLVAAQPLAGVALLLVAAAFGVLFFDA